MSALRFKGLKVHGSDTGLIEPRLRKPYANFFFKKNNVLESVLFQIPSTKEGLQLWLKTHSDSAVHFTT